LRLRLLLAATVPVACDSAPAAPDLPDPPVVLAVECAVGSLPDIVYDGFQRPPVDVAWSGSARMEDGTTAVLDSAVVKLDVLTIRRYRDANAGATTLAAWETKDGLNNLIVTCHKGPRSLTANEPFRIFRR